VVDGGVRAPDLLLSGWLAPTCLVVEVKDANDIHDCKQANDLLRLDPASLAREVYVGSRTGYRPLFSCPVEKAAMLSEGLDACGIEKMAVVAVQPSLIRTESGEIGDGTLDSLLATGIPLPVADPEELPAEYFPFCPEAPDWEIARWLMRTLMVFAIQDHPPFTHADLAQAAAGFAWGLLSDDAKAEVEATVNRLMNEARGDHLEGVFLNVGGRITFNQGSVRDSHGALRRAFEDRCRSFVNWKESTRAVQTGLGLV
jgi:hypothetical protein